MIKMYKDIIYALSRSERKTASIYIERDGKVAVLVPSTLTDRQIEGLIESKRRWIYTSLAEWRDLNATRVQRSFVNGEGFLYLGRSYRLRLVEAQDKPLVLKDGYFCLRHDGRAAGDEGFDEAFKEFYRSKGMDRIPRRVAVYQAKMGVEAGQVRVLDLKNRWASCSSKGNLNFHWRCMMAPPTIIDYIAVHELAHLNHPNHTQAFWNEVDKIMPDFGERKGWLRIHGAGMDL